MAPVIAPRSEPPAAAAPEPQPAPEPPSPAAGTPLVAAAGANPRRNQTLLGIAPVIPTQPKPADAAPAGEPASSVPSILTPPAAIATDAPTSSDVAALAPAAKAVPRRAEAARPAAALSISHDDLPELKPARSRATWALGVAAALALGVFGLRQLDRAPTPVPAELARPVGAAKATNAAPKSDEDDDGNVPNTGTDTQPQPMPSEPEPVGVNAKADDNKPTTDTDASATASAAASTAPAASGSIVRINITSQPPGARLFRRGKEQGTTPFVLEFPAGERHSYELGLPGYTVRKVVIDGSKTDISIGMRPDPAANSGAKPRK